jgi:hypothetical protein
LISLLDSKCFRCPFSKNPAHLPYVTLARDINSARGREPTSSSNAGEVGKIMQDICGKEGRSLMLGWSLLSPIGLKPY